MAELDGFHLRLICAAYDLPFSDAVFQAELTALLQSFSLNDSGIIQLGRIRLKTEARPSMSVFVTLKQAIPSLWEGIIGWI